MQKNNTAVNGKFGKKKKNNTQNSQQQANKCINYRRKIRIKPNFRYQTVDEQKQLCAMHTAISRTMKQYETMQDIKKPDKILQKK